MPNAALCERSGMRYINQHTGLFLKDLTRCFAKVVVFQHSATSPEHLNLSNYLLENSNKLNVITRLWSGSHRIGKFFSYIRVLPRVFRELTKIDVGYFFLPGHLPLFAAMSMILLSKPYGIYLRGERNLNNPVARFAMKKAKFILTTGNTLADRARSYCPEVDLVTPMIDIKLEDLYTKSRPVKTGGWVLLYVGRVEEAKGIFDLIDAAQKLLSQGYDLHVNIVGPVEDRHRVFDHIAPGFKEKIIFHGAIHDREKLFQFYRQADLFVFPSHDEGFPRVLYEAMSVGLPIITTFVGSIGSVLEDGRHCLRANLKDSDNLVQLIGRCLSDKDLRILISQNGLALMRDILVSSNKSHARQVYEKVHNLC